MIDLGVEIRVARIRARMSQKDLSQQLFCDQAVISRMETGKMQISHERLMAIAEITGIDLLNGKGV